MRSPSTSSSLERAGQGSCTHQGDPPFSDGNEHGSGITEVESCCFSQSFKRGYDAYILHAEKKTFAASARSQSLLKQSDGKRGGGVGGAGVEQRVLESLASAWELHNRPRIGAVRFAGAHLGKGAASVAAVLALIVVPALVERKLTCYCEVSGLGMLWWIDNRDWLFSFWTGRGNGDFRSNVDAFTVC